MQYRNHLLLGLIFLACTLDVQGRYWSHWSRLHSDNQQYEIFYFDPYNNNEFSFFGIKNRTPISTYNRYYSDVEGILLPYLEEFYGIALVFPLWKEADAYGLVNWQLVEGELTYSLQIAKIKEDTTIFTVEPDTIMRYDCSFDFNFQKHYLEYHSIAIPHKETNNVWMIFTNYDCEKEENRFYAYLVNETGLLSGPVVSPAPPLHSINPRQYRDLFPMMTSSSDGNFLALHTRGSNFNHHKYETIYTFNRNTGKVEDKIFSHSMLDKPPFGADSLYTFEGFSPNSRFAYFSKFENLPDTAAVERSILQYDLTGDSPEEIFHSEKVLLRIIHQPEGLGQISGLSFTGNDGRIYPVRLPHRNLASFKDQIKYITQDSVFYPDPTKNDIYFRMEYPNRPGSEAGISFIDHWNEGVHNESSVFGTSWISYPFMTMGRISAENLCLGDTTLLRFTSQNHIPDSIHWEITGMDMETETYRGDTVLKVFPDTGEYRIRAVRFYENRPVPDTMYKSIYIGIDFSPSLMENVITCIPDTVTLSAGADNKRYLWSTGSYDKTITATDTGWYYVDIRGRRNACLIRDSVHISSSEPGYSDIIKTPPVVLCYGDSVQLQTSGNFDSYQWSTGDTTDNIWVKEAGKYSIETLNNYCRLNDTLSVIRPWEGMPELPKEEHTLCHADLPLEIMLPDGFSTYRWDDGLSGQERSILASGTYGYIMTEKGCSLSGSITVKAVPEPEATLPETEYFCSYEEMLVLEAGEAEQYYWSPGAVRGREYTVTDTGKVMLTMINEPGCSTTSEVMVIDDCPYTLYIPNAFSPGSINTKFTIYGQNLKEVELIIYNRWGAELYRETSKKPSWDGRINGELLPEGTYVYKIRYIALYRNQEQRGEKTGVVHLVR